MKNKIEIQILSPATRQQLIELRDEIRNMEGFEAFDLQLPQPQLDTGKMMSPELMDTILHGVVAGVVHFTAEKTFEEIHQRIAIALKRILGKSKQHHILDQVSTMGNTTEGGWKAIVSEERNGLNSVVNYDQSGATNIFRNREYSIETEHTHAIIIGVSDYEDKTNFSPIPPVAGNLNDMYNILCDKRLVALPFGNITRLYNENSIEIKNKIRDVSRKKDIKTLIFYYSGHGHNMGNNKLSLVAKDTMNIDEELHNDVPYTYVEKMINSSPAEQKIIFIDACHSGLAAQGGSNNVFDFAPVLGTFTLASTSAEEASYFKKDAHNTYFTSYLLEVFKEGVTGANAMLSLTDIYNFTKQKLAKINLPAPVCKQELKNIDANNFFLSPNPGFSLVDRLNRPKQLYQQGKYQEARREFLLLEKDIHKISN